MAPLTMAAKARKTPVPTVAVDTKRNRDWKPMPAMTLIAFWIRWIVIARMRGGMRLTVQVLVARILSEDIMDARDNCIYWLRCLAVACNGQLEPGCIPFGLFA